MERRCVTCMHYDKGAYEDPCSTCIDLHHHYGDAHTEDNFRYKHDFDCGLKMMKSELESLGDDIQTSLDRMEKDFIDSTNMPATKATIASSVIWLNGKISVLDDVMKILERVESECRKESE